MKDTDEPNISVREHIRWVPGTPTEPTSTLVLTSAAHRFVDVRIHKPKAAGEPDLPNEGGPLSRLEWAFAGTSHSSPLPASSASTTGGEAPAFHSIWTHWLDSRTADPGVDEGDMYPQPDGVHVLEQGSMTNPADGTVTRYEENWADVRVLSTSTTSPATAETGSGPAKARDSIVLVLEDVAHGVKGMVVRVGQFCQGIVKVGDEVSVERWAWSGGAKGTAEATGWTRTVKLGRLFLPCALTFEPDRVVEGSKVDYGDYKWEVVEVVQW